MGEGGEGDSNEIRTTKSPLVEIAFTRHPINLWEGKREK